MPPVNLPGRGRRVVPSLMALALFGSACAKGGDEDSEPQGQGGSSAFGGASTGGKGGSNFGGSNLGGSNFGGSNFGGSNFGGSTNTGGVAGTAGTASGGSSGSAGGGGSGGTGAGGSGGTGAGGSGGTGAGGSGGTGGGACEPLKAFCGTAPSNLKTCCLPATCEFDPSDFKYYCCLGDQESCGGDPDCCKGLFCKSGTCQK